MTFRVLLAIALLSTTTSVIYGAPVRSGGDRAVDKGVIPGAPVPSGGDRAVERGGFDDIQDMTMQAMAIIHQLTQLQKEIEEAYANGHGSGSPLMGQLNAQYHQLHAQAQSILDQVYG
ncbi:PREDICTED: uncharacterized protein LOC109469211 [Branchiostoma belcheri]|uniref:Uncharacterized protein LOC109469211 n=1 Tax=Branchiostoma belcheri TaxID=7741 RepID=A0A6P4YWU9_BRABE|nr:PREDICTED: uncharacterized protein LOC109469211 [Branchiostoma belcheri]